MKLVTPDNITELEDGEVFVFGSNLAGIHAGGAAKLAKEKFGAVDGQGEGLQGKCYAFPTLDEEFNPLLFARLLDARDKLYQCARMNPNNIFLLTKVGCGIAGMKEEAMKVLFQGERPENIIVPDGW